MVSREAAERFLSAPYLNDTDSATRQAVLHVLMERREQAGTVLLEYGQPNDHILFLIDGSARVVRPYPEGREEDVATLTAPAVFGESSFFRPLLPIVSVRAFTDVWLLTLDHEAHALLRRFEPRAAEQLARRGQQLRMELGETGAGFFAFAVAHQIFQPGGQLVDHGHGQVARRAADAVQAVLHGAPIDIGLAGAR